jgi:YVTN family beta-propeller protein
MTFKLIFLFAVFLSLISCKKDKPEPDPEAPATLKNGWLILNEGLFQQNNSHLSWVDLETGITNNEIFEQKASRPLGDTGNDIIIYGAKIYVCVNVSSTIEVMDRSSGNFIKQISMQSGGQAKQPRYMVGANGKLYVSCYDGYVDVIDTVSMQVSQRIKVGANPEELVVSNGKLYVANSGGLNYPDVDSTISVISLATHQELKKITIGPNPGPVAVDSQGEIYAISRGDYGSIPSRLHRIDSNADSLIQTFTEQISSISRMKDQFIVTVKEGQTSRITTLNCLNETLAAGQLFTYSQFTTLYKIQYLSTRDKIYCFDAMSYTNSGYVHEFSTSGQEIRKYKVGLIPSQIIVYE